MSKLLVDAGDGEWMLGIRFCLQLIQILLCGVPMQAIVAQGFFANSGIREARNVITQGRIHIETRSFSTIAEREKLIIECFRSDIGVTCNYTATYFLNNKADEDEEITGALLGSRIFQIAQNGKNISIKLTNNERVAIYDAVKWDLEQDTRVQEDGWVLENGSNTSPMHDMFRVAGFRAAFPPGRSTLQINGQVDLRCRDYTRKVGGLWAIHARHVISFDGKERCDILRYPLFPPNTWGGKPQIDIEIIGRELLDLKVYIDDKMPNTQKAGTWNERQYFHLEGTVPGWLRVVPKYTNSLLGRGGFRFGIGDSPTYGFSGQAGYDYGLGPLFILGVDVTSNFRDYHAAAAMLEFALPNMLLIFPSLSIGAGIPYDFGEGKRFGYRLQTGANFIFIGFQALWDFYREPDGRYEFRNLYFATVSF